MPDCTDPNTAEVDKRLYPQMHSVGYFSLLSLCMRLMHDTVLHIRVLQLNFHNMKEKLLLASDLKFQMLMLACSISQFGDFSAWQSSTCNSFPVS